MIAFVSLFLGLVFGTKPVELTVGPEVAAVEIRLDGAVVATLRGEPWSAPCDFGNELMPRLLEAVALDAAGRELDRARQWLNLPQPKAVADVVLEPPLEGRPRIARISWESSVGAEPTSVTASLDGRPLAVDDLRRIELPAVDESRFHLLHVELRFKDGVTSRLDVTFGSEYAEEVSTEMTALPIVATGRARPPSAAGAEGWFLKDGKPLRVIAVERETAEIVLVMARPFPRFFGPGERFKVPKALELDDDLALRFATTRPEEKEGVTTTFELFPISPAYDGEGSDLYDLLTRVLRPPQDRPDRPTAAVAVAGLAAYEGRHRRAVVLIPGDGPWQDDAVSPAQVRRYLERLRVPLVVWDPKARRGDELAAWGERREVGSLEALAEAFRELEARLEKQWVVWIDGRHLPQEITLAPGVEGFALP